LIAAVAAPAAPAAIESALASELDMDHAQAAWTTRKRGERWVDCSSSSSSCWECVLPRAVLCCGSVECMPVNAADAVMCSLPLCHTVPCTLQALLLHHLAGMRRCVYCITAGVHWRAEDLRQPERKVPGTRRCTQAVRFNARAAGVNCSSAATAATAPAVNSACAPKRGGYLPAAVVALATVLGDTTLG
jgi:hypothetical protein